MHLHHNPGKLVIHPVHGTVTDYVYVEGAEEVLFLFASLLEWGWMEADGWLCRAGLGWSVCRFMYSFGTERER